MNEKHYEDDRFGISLQYNWINLPTEIPLIPLNPAIWVLKLMNQWTHPEEKSKEIRQKKIIELTLIMTERDLFKPHYAYK